MRRRKAHNTRRDLEIARVTVVRAPKEGTRAFARSVEVGAILLALLRLSSSRQLPIAITDGHSSCNSPATPFKTDGAVSPLRLVVADVSRRWTGYIIRSPTTVRIERTNDGADVALEIESAEGTTALLRLQP
jgi:hypothetical protein